MYGAIYLGLNATVESARYVIINGPFDNTTIPNDSSSAVEDPTYIIKNIENN